MLDFSSTRTVSVGEAMIEMAVTEDGTYRRSFAGDTFNTAWHMSQIPGAGLRVGFLSMVGTDPVSDEFVAALGQDGLDTDCIGRVPDRTMGLYMIQLDGAERSFLYWRDASAARQLAEDEAFLTRSLAGAGLIHVSGITLGILNSAARTRLMTALATTRSTGARISFDPNIRPRLWSSPEETREAISGILALTDIALPSFDDEAALWGDETPEATVTRLRDAGVREIAVKNGADPVSVWTGEYATDVATPAVEIVRDTSGAGDAFNAGYLGARVAGQRPVDAVASGQAMSAAVLQHFGARIPKGQVPPLTLSHSR